MGHLPESEADQLLKLCPAELVKKPTNKKFVNKSDLTAALHQATVGGEGKGKKYFLYKAKFVTVLVYLLLFF